MLCSTEFGVLVVGTAVGNSRNSWSRRAGSLIDFHASLTRGCLYFRGCLRFFRVINLAFRFVIDCVAGKQVRLGGRHVNPAPSKILLKFQFLIRSSLSAELDRFAQSFFSVVPRPGWEKRSIYAGTYGYIFQHRPTQKITYL